MKWEGFTGNYDNLDKDIFFSGLTKDVKGRTEFDDVAKCMVWEENRTKYHTIENFRQIIDFSRGVRVLFEDLREKAKTPEQNDNVMELWKKFRDDFLFNTFDLEGLTRIYHYWGNFPTNIPSWPEKAYLSHSPKVRKTWKYDPFEDRKKYESLRFKSIGDKEFKDYSEGKAKKATMKVPVTIEVDPVYDEANLKRVLVENVHEIIEMAQERKSCMEKEGYTFRKEKPKDERPRSWYETGLRYLGHYRLYKCKGLEFHNVEKTFLKGWEKKKAKPIERDTFMKKVKNELPFLPW
jgi:hypothetical protein